MADPTENEPHDGLPDPFTRHDFLAEDRVETTLRQRLDNRTLTHGWILAGPRGIGKATLAARIARAKLAPEALLDDSSLACDPAHPMVRLVDQRAHPDLFIAERIYDEKKKKVETDLPVDRIRQMTARLQHTASSGHGRVAIIDPADAMNANAANALLKILEEPPADTLILLLANSPGALLPTLRSRCRMIRLRPVATTTLAALLMRDLGLDGPEADRLAEAARGRPGYALDLATQDGAEAIRLAEDFLRLCDRGAQIRPIARKFAGKNADSLWPVFRDHLFAQLAEAARAAAMAKPEAEAAPARFVIGWERLTELCSRGERLNLDRVSLIEAMGHDLGDALSIPN